MIQEKKRTFPLHAYNSKKKEEEEEKNFKIFLRRMKNSKLKKKKKKNSSMRGEEELENREEETSHKPCSSKLQSNIFHSHQSLFFIAKGVTTLQNSISLLLVDTLIG